MDHRDPTLAAARYGPPCQSAAVGGAVHGVSTSHSRCVLECGGRGAALAGQPMAGVEPATPALRKPCSTIELHRRHLCEADRLRRSVRKLKAPKKPRASQTEGTGPLKGDTTAAISFVVFTSRRIKQKSDFFCDSCRDLFRTSGGRGGRGGAATTGCAGYARRRLPGRAANPHLQIGRALGIGRRGYGTFRQGWPWRAGEGWRGVAASSIKQTRPACRCFSGWLQMRHWRATAG